MFRRTWQGHSDGGYIGIYTPQIKFMATPLVRGYTRKLKHKTFA